MTEIERRLERLSQAQAAIQALLAQKVRDDADTNPSIPRIITHQNLKIAELRELVTRAMDLNVEHTKLVLDVIRELKEAMEARDVS